MPADGVPALAEGEHEILMPRRGEDFHDVPDQRPAADLHQGLGDALACFRINDAPAAA
jgi:hypothetical protein